MKKMLLIVSLLPTIVFAQPSAQQNSNKTNPLKIRFSKMTLDKCTNVNGPGDWTLNVEDHKVTDESRTPTDINVEHDYIIAENVEIEGKNFPLLKADKMVFNELTAHATYHNSGQGGNQGNSGEGCPGHIPRQL